MIVKNKTVSYNKAADILLVISFFLYTYRGNLGAMVAVCSFIARMCSRKIRMKHTKILLLAWSIYLSAFAILSYSIRAVNFKMYVFIAYSFAVFNIFAARQINFNYVAKLLYKGSAAYVFSVWLQFLVPGVYTPIVRVLFSSDNYYEIIKRMSNGYMTGFTREVAYVALIIVIGLLYIVFLYKGKYRIPLAALYLITLFLTGKKAHPILVVVAIILTYYLMTENLKKHLKIWLICLALLGVAALTFPIWKNISFMSRIVVFINGIQSGLDANALTSGREVIYQRAFNLWSDNKMFGIGWTNFRSLGAYGTSEYTTWFNNYDVHNCYLQILCETGIAGMIPFIVIFLLSFAVSIKKLRSQKSGEIKYSFAYFLFFWLYAISEPCLFQDSYFIFLFLCIGEIAWNIQEKPFDMIGAGRKLVVHIQE